MGVIGGGTAKPLALIVVAEVNHTEIKDHRGDDPSQPGEQAGVIHLRVGHGPIKSDLGVLFRALAELFGVVVQPVKARFKAVNNGIDFIRHKSIVSKYIYSGHRLPEGIAPW